MRKRSFPGQTGFWRQRFVQIARELEASTGPSASGAAIRPRMHPGAMPRVRAPLGRPNAA